MAQQTWTGSSLVSEVLLDDIPDNETELYTRVGYLEDEIEAARDGESSLLVKQQAQDTATATVTAEVEAARDGAASLLVKQQTQDAATAAVAAEIEAARDGAASLLVKQQTQDAAIAAAQVLVTFNYPAQTGQAGNALFTDGEMPYWADVAVPCAPYDDRANLRTTVGTEGDLCIVESLGLFRFFEASAELDDDESCFDTASGKWLLELPSWDLIVSILYSEMAQINKAVPKILSGAAFCAISTIATLNYASFVSIIDGANIGDIVLVTPPSAIGSAASDTGKISYYGVVTASNTVTIYLCNASASTATVAPTANTYWSISVIKKEII